MNYAFLPLSDRVKLKREYRVRALVVFFFLLSVSVLVGVAFLFPAFINSKVAENQELGKIADINKTNNESGLEIIKKQLEQDDVLLENANTALETPIFYMIIKSIVLARGGVKLNSIAFTGYSTSTVDVIIQGYSLTRDGLTSFKNRLETSMPGSIADLPLSGLAKNKNISFSMKFTYSI